MERRIIKKAILLTRDKSGGKKIRGTAAVTYREGEPGTEYDLSGYGLKGVKERIMPGAFDGVLDGDTYAAINHNPDLVFARTTSGTLKLWADKNGLHYEATPSDTDAGKNAVGHTEAGDFGGSSFAFTVAPGGETWRNDGDIKVREINSIEALVDVSPVVSPAYKSTSVDARHGADARASYDKWLAELDTDMEALKNIQKKLEGSIQQHAEEDEAPAEEPADDEEQNHEQVSNQYRAKLAKIKSQL